MTSREENKCKKVLLSADEEVIVQQPMSKKECNIKETDQNMSRFYLFNDNSHLNVPVS